MQRRRGRTQHPAGGADAEETLNRMHEILLRKYANEEDDFHSKASDSVDAVASFGPSASAAKGTPNARTSYAESLVGSADGAGTRSSGSGSGGGCGRASGSGSLAARKRGGASGDHAGYDLALASLPPFELEKERMAYHDSVCGDSTRLDVQEWVNRIFNMRVARGKEAAQMNAQQDRRRRARSSCASESGTSTSIGTTLLNAGTSVASAERPTSAPKKAPSMISAESLVVHDGKGVELLSARDRLRAYLANEIPQLRAHVDACVEARSETIRRRIDGELRDAFLKRTTRQNVFGNMSNYLRWQNYRQGYIQRTLDAEMPQWIWEAIKSWDQFRVSEDKEPLPEEGDLIFDYLTKRAAHIDSTQLATEIPIFKPLMASYSLPAMWRDKYNM